MTVGRVSVGHPIDVGSGVQFTACEDVEIGGHFPIIWRRFYSTALLKSPKSIHGPGWVVNYSMRLEIEDKQFKFYGHDGIEAVFDMTSWDGKSGVFDFGQSMELRKVKDRVVIYHWHDWQTEVHKFIFTIEAKKTFRLDRIELPSGHGVQMHYDDADRLVKVLQDIEQRALVISYDLDGRVVSLQLNGPLAAGEHICTYEYDEKSALVGVIDALGQRMVYGYDNKYRLTTEIDRGGIATYIKYDEKGRCVESTRKDRVEYCRVSYNPATRTSITTNSLGSKTTYSLNSVGQVISETHANGLVIETEFDYYGRIVRKIRSSGLTTSYAYDAMGNLATEIAPNGGTLTVTYDDEHLPLKIIDADGACWSMAYENGALVATTDPIGHRRLFTLDRQNVLQSLITTTGNHIWIERDRDWTVEKLFDSFGLIAETRYDNFLNIIAIGDARGLRRTFTHDALGQVVTMTEADGTQDQFVRDGNGQVIAYTDKNGSLTRYAYDPNGAYLAVLNPNGAKCLYRFNTEGWLTSITNALGEISTFEYDSIGNRTRTIFFDGRIESCTYDLEGRCIGRTKADGSLLQFSYNTFGSITSVSSEGAALIVNEYDICGQLKSTRTPDTIVEFERDLCGRVIAETQSGRKVRYAFGTSGAVEFLSWDRSKLTGIHFGYDLRGRLVSISSSEKQLENFDYDATDSMTKRSFASVAELFEFDTRLRVSRQNVVDKTGKVLVARSFNYDAESNLTHQNDAFRGAVDYTYDSIGMLSQSSHSSGKLHAYEYDLAGNKTKSTDNAFVYEVGNRLIADANHRYILDANANRIGATSSSGTVSYVWDALDQLSKIIQPDQTVVTYAYDGLGRRVKKVEAESTIEYLWAGDELLSAETQDSVVEYLSSEFHPEIVWLNGRAQHVVSSHIDAPYELFDEHGKLVWRGNYDDLGRLQDEFRFDATDVRMPGQQFDAESNLHYNRFRYYDPQVGRYISPDPIGLEGGLNQFLFGLNAINWIDPLGLSCNKGSHKNSVYVLKKNGKIVYIGITSRDPKARKSEHARGTAKTKPKDFDEMVVVAKGLSRRQARNIEGSALLTIQKGNGTNADGTAINSSKMQNARRNDGVTFYHSYDKSTKGPGRQVFNSGEVNKTLNPQSPVATYPNP
jgi:RHS repeat-associated protein